MQTDDQVIRDLVAKWNHASASGDIETITNLIANDAVFLVAGRPPFGKEAFVANFRSGLEHVKIQAESEIQEINVVGAHAFMRTHLWVTITPRGGGVPMKRRGYTLSVLRKDPDGGWQLVRDANLLTADTSA